MFFYLIKNRCVMALGVILLLAGCLPGKKNLRKNLPEPLQEGDIIHLASSKKVPYSTVEEFLSFPKVLYVGESHKNMEAHRVQLDFLKTFHSKFGSEIVIGMEMFKRPYQAVLDDWVAGRLDEKTFLKKTHWYKEWGFDFRLYRDLLNFARDHKIPLVALTVTDNLKKEISAKGLSGLDENLKKELPEIDLSDPYHRLYLEKIYSYHINDEDRFEKFYQVQCLWEDFMAESISNYLTSPEGKGKRMIVFTGNGHIVYDFGVPKRVFGRTNLPYLSIYTYEKEREAGGFDPVLFADIPLEPADFMMVIPWKYLKRKHAFLGVSLEMTKAEKVIIRKVYKGSPAAKAGFKENDIILKIEGEQVTERFDIVYTLKQKEIGDSCKFTVLRGESTLDISVKFFSWDYH